MYTVLVSPAITAPPFGTVSISKSRYLEHTNDVIAKQLQSLSLDAVECLKSWPCVLMQEGRSGEQAYVAKLADVSESGSDVRVRIEGLNIDKKLSNEVLWKR